MMKTKDALIALAIAFMLILPACGSREETVEYDASSVPEGQVLKMPDGMEQAKVPGMESPGEKDEMINNTRIMMDAIKEGKLPADDVMARLPQEQQDAVRRAIEAKAGQK